ncbi:hypothetical protein [Streptomyces sp. NBC_00096]|uniref:hypothetical protein n=1 Tax=Streptomyces sp. NBC_00096 TaxID=2975650 RepID=UPI0032438C3E
MNTRPSDEAPGPGAGTRPPGEPTAVPAAAGLGLLSLGGWLLTTARPWQKPNSPLTLALDWTASGALMICGLVLLTRCIRTVHRSHEAPYETPYEASRDTPLTPPAHPGGATS